MSHPAIITTGDSSQPAKPAESLQREIAQLEKLREQVFSDMESLRAQEHQLRAYENRLREARPQPGPVAAGAASAGVEELQVAWEKFQRAQALLEAERRALTDERMAFREQAAAVQQREVEVKRREAWLAQREAELAAAAAAAAAEKPAASTGLRLGLKEIPFAEFFRSNNQKSA